METFLYLNWQQNLTSPELIWLQNLTFSDLRLSVRCEYL